MAFCVFFSRKISLRSSAAALALASVAACSGGGSGSEGSTSPTPTPTPPAATGQSFSLNGLVSKGLIKNGYVSVVEPASPNTKLVTGRTDGTTGQYDLSIPASANFESDFVKVIVSGGNDATMICDAPSGCGDTVTFGDSFAIDSSFSISALIAAPGEGETRAVHVTALTDMVAQIAEDASENGVISTENLDTASSQVSALFGLTSTELSLIAPIDVTNADASVIDQQQLKLSLINAGIMSALVEAGGNIGNTFYNFVDTFVSNDGQLVANEGTDNLTLISLEDILKGASQVVATTPLEDNNLAIIGADLNGALAEIDTLSEGELTEVRPSPNIGLTDLEKAKAFVADIRLLQAAIENESSATKLETFSAEIEESANLVADDAAELTDDIVLVFNEMTTAYDLHLADPTIVQFESTHGFTVNMASNLDASGSTAAPGLTAPDDGILMSVDAEIGTSNISLEFIAAIDETEENIDSTPEESSLSYFYQNSSQTDSFLTVIDARASNEAVSLEINALDFNIENYYAFEEAKGTYSYRDYGTQYQDSYENQISFAKLGLVLDVSLSTLNANVMSFEGKISAESIDLHLETTERSSYQDGKNHPLYPQDEYWGVYAFADTDASRIGNTKISLSGEFVTQSNSLDMTLSADFLPNGFSILNEPEQVLFSTYEIENNILTDTRIDTGSKFVIEAVSASDAIAEAQALGFTVPADRFSLISDEETENLYRVYIKDTSAPVLKYTFYILNEEDELEVSDIILYQVGTFGNNTEEFIANPPIDNIAKFYNDFWDTEYSINNRAFCTFDKIVMGTPAIYDEEAESGEFYDTILLDNVPCETATGEDIGYFLPAYSTETLVGDADYSIFASIRQDIVGIDADSPEVEISIAAAGNISADNALSTGALTIEFAGRRYETNAHTFDLSEIEDIENFSVTNQDNVKLTMSLANDETSGNITVDGTEYATISEDQGAIIFTYSDGEFESIY